MAKILMYVHGTGVREEGYAEQKKIIEERLSKLNENTEGEGFHFKECFWGATVGARLGLGGVSVPLYQETKVRVKEKELPVPQLWELLLLNPLLELQMLSGMTVDDSERVNPPPGFSPMGELTSRFDALAENPKIVEALTPYALISNDRIDGQASVISAVVTSIKATEAFTSAAESPGAGSAQHRDVLARAVLASILRLALDHGAPLPNKKARDDLEGLLAEALAYSTRGPMTALLKPLMAWGTWYSRRNRAELSETATPAAGDILLYQARGEKLRSFIRARLAAFPNDEIYLLAHSLGGIASVETLVEEPAINNVKRLITFGSQAPFLYELNALKMLPTGTSLPKHFPPWSNFYDPADMLSYLAEGVFTKERVTDHPLESGLSFPAAHSAYLRHDPFWLLLESLLKNA